MYKKKWLRKFRTPIKKQLTRPTPFIKDYDITKQEYKVCYGHCYAKAIAGIHLDPQDPGLFSLDLDILCFVVHPLHWSLRGGICPCRHCRRQCKIFASGVNFSNFTHLFVFFLTKTVEIRWNWRCKIFSLKIRRCKILDKFHVCLGPWSTHGPI